MQASHHMPVSSPLSDWVVRLWMLREWASDMGATGTVAAPAPQMPALSMEKTASGALGSTATQAIPEPSQTLPLNLPEALGLAGAENPTIAIARLAVVAALAEQTQAPALLLPNLNAGTNYDYHAGTLQSSFGAIREVDRQALYVGAGADAIGAGTVAIPGVQLVSPLTDAIYAPGSPAMWLRPGSLMHRQPITMCCWRWGPFTTP